MKSIRKEFSVWSIVTPLYWTLRGFGLACFSTVGDIRNGRTKMRLTDFIHLLCMLGLQCYVCYIHIYVDTSMSRTKAVVIDTSAHGIEIFNGFTIVLGTILYAVFRKKIWSLFGKIYKFDVEVRKLNSNLNQS